MADTFHLLQKLHEDTLGIVYLAETEFPTRSVIVKVYPYQIHDVTLLSAIEQAAARESVPFLLLQKDERALYAVLPSDQLERVLFL
jgi:hypothetical protein